MYLMVSAYNYVVDAYWGGNNQGQETMERPSDRKQSAPSTSSAMMAAASAASAVAGCSCGHQHHSHNLKSSRLDTPPATPPLPSTPVTVRRPQGVAFADNSALTPAISVSSIPRGSTGGNLLATRGSLSGSNALLPGSERRTSIWSNMDRRPSALLQLGSCGACGDQRRFLISILRNAQQSSHRSLTMEPSSSSPQPSGSSSPKITIVDQREERSTPPVTTTAPTKRSPAPPYSERAAEENQKKTSSLKMEDDALTAGLSALYAKLLFVLGMAFPVAEVISDKVPKSFDQGLYLYLHLVSLAFMIYMYATLMRDKSVYSVVNSYNVDVEGDNPQPVYVRNRHRDVPMIRYGSFYLRAGAIAFGIGSMIYSGLEFGQYFELEEDSDCQNVLLAVTPAMRMVLTIMQIQFLFLNNRFEMGKYRLVARFGLMHMLATNMCEWMYVLVEEAKHEIMHLTHHPLAGHGHTSHGNHTDDDHHERVDRAAHTQNCMRTNIMGSLVQNASPFLFPCTIEYSLICAVILYEMWKNVNTMIASKRHHSNKITTEDDKALLNGYKLAAGKLIDPSINHHHFSVDCASAHRGLFSGIIILVLTIISLIMFFVLIRDPLFSRMAVFEVNVCEIIMYIASTVAVIVCMKQMRELDYKRGKHGFELDGILIVVAQTGMYVYCLFSIIGSYFSDTDNAPGGLLVELCSLIQTTCQTIFILDACWRRCSNVFQVRRKPGRQLVTFLLVANLAMWTINALEKNRAEFHPTHLEFYGVWAWTIITHVSMPLAVFYRFHSTVCLLEIWKTAYKLKHETSH